MITQEAINSFVAFWGQYPPAIYFPKGQCPTDVHAIGTVLTGRHLCPKCRERCAFIHRVDFRTHAGHNWVCGTCKDKAEGK